MPSFVDLNGARSFLARMREKMNAELDKIDWRQDGSTFKYGKVYKNVSPFVEITGVNSVENITINTDTKVVTIPSSVWSSDTQITVSSGYTYSTISGGGE